MDGPVFFFNRIPTRERMEFGDVVGCEWMGCVQVQKEEEKIGARLVERGRFKYASRRRFSEPVAGWRGER